MVGTADVRCPKVAGGVAEPEASETETETETSAQSAQAEPPVRIAPVGVEVIRYLTHHPVDPPLPLTETGIGHPGEFGDHVVDVAVGRGRTVCFQTTMGTPHTSQSATQQMSSS